MRGLSLRPVLVAATLAVGSLSLAVPAQAGGPLDSAGSATADAAIPFAPCQPGGVAGMDRKIADRLRPAMTGRRLGSSVTGYSISCARAIVGHVRALGLDQRAAVIAVTAAITESTLHNYTVAVDHDSLGLFQQRPSKGWGRPDQLTDPGDATRRFLHAMIRNYPAGGWVTGDIGQICQRVQRSAYPAAYAPEAHDAHLIVAQLWTVRAAPAGAAVTSAPAKPKKLTGPFQRSVMAAPTGRGVTDARHDASMADWNGDRKADLVMVQRSGTITGRTELYVFDGASKFQRLLLHTGTALPPTDERHAFSVADWNGDGRPDLVVIYKSDTATGRTELQVVDGASSFQRYLLHTATALGPTDHRHAMSVADWNGDSRLDLVMVQKSGTASRRTEVRVLDGSSGFARDLLQTSTRLGSTDDRHDVAVADWNRDSRLDLVVVQKSGAASRRTEVRVLDGASDFERFLLQTRSAEGPTDDRHDLSVADVSGDGRPDLVVVQKSGTASGRTEVRVLAG